MMKQCRVLIVNSNGGQTTHHQALVRRGFLVAETREWPADETIRGYEVVIVVLRHIDSTCMLAARMRAKRWFGRRVLIGLSPASPTIHERREAIGAGFDDIFDAASSSRLLLARILQRLRARPEHRCLLPDRKRSAA
jgi:hypothetical protein